MNPPIQTIAIHHKDGPKSNVLYHRLVACEGLLIKACGLDGHAVLPGLATAGSIPAIKVAEIVGNLKSKLADAQNKCGKVIVRYLTDFKPSEYPLDVRFFHLAETTVQDEMSSLIRNAANSGLTTTRLVNMATVRDIEIRFESVTVADIVTEFRCMTGLLEALEQCVASGGFIRIE